MKKEELFETLQDLDDELIREAEGHVVKKSKSRKLYAYASIAAVFMLALIAGVIFREKKPVTSGTSSVPESMLAETEARHYIYPERLVSINPSYPVSAIKDMDAQTFTASDQYWKWFSNYREKAEASSGLQARMMPYCQALIGNVLAESGENVVCSPLNTYIAFSMLAELTDGNTRRQLLDMLGAEDIETLRRNVSSLWNSNYADTPVLKSLLANSVWIDQAAGFNEKTLSRLAETYYASSVSGDMASSEMLEALKTWINENTGGLLEDYVDSIKLDSEIILMLVSTIYYKAAWRNIFFTSETKEEIFHGEKGDQTVQMMHSHDSQGVYYGEKYTAVRLSLQDSGFMYFFLPDEGTDVSELASDPEVYEMLTRKTDMDEAIKQEERWAFPLVNLSVPKFSVSGSSDLKKALVAMGATDVLEASKADFSPLTAAEGMFLSSADHTAMVEIDENGVTAAAHTAMALAGGMLPEEIIDLVFDRPFMFVITGFDGSLLFSGIVRNID